MWMQSNWLSPGQCVSQSAVWEDILGSFESSGLTAGGHGSATGAPPGWLMQACLKSSQGEWSLFISFCTLHTPGPTSRCYPSTLLTGEMLHWSELTVVWNWGEQTAWYDRYPQDVLHLCWAAAFVWFNSPYNWSPHNVVNYHVSALESSNCFFLSDQQSKI